MLTASAPSNHTRRLSRTVLAAGALTLAAACGTSAPAPSAAPPAAAPAAPGSSAAGTATTVTVTMTDFKLALDQSALKPGSYTFHAVNAGKAGHVLEIEGPGIEEQKTALVTPGNSADLAVTLPAGSFDMYCPVDGHRGMGMELALKVG